MKCLSDLAEHGPLKPEALRGLTTPETINPAVEMLKEEEKKFAFPKPNSQERENPDKTGFRTGIAPKEEIAEKILSTIQSLKPLLSFEKCDRRETVEEKDFLEAINLLKGAVMIAYPGYYNLPEWDPVYLILEGKMDFPTTYPDCNWLEEKSAVLWWAKKELKGDKKLSDYVGKNEKTKIIVKINKKGSGAPVSEPMIDQETQKKMMSYYYKKQEEQKKLEENDEDDYLNSQWANPQNMKMNLVTGGRDIRLK